jgi:hypothetical protein
MYFLKVIISESLFPEIRYLLRIEAGLLACVLLFTFPFAKAISGICR